MEVSEKMKILVAYASKHQSTAEIAARIAQKVRSDRWQVDLMPVSAVVNPDQYDAIVLGSAIYMGQWMNSAAEFILTHENMLTERPTWLFSSGPTGEGDAVKLVQGFTFPVVLAGVAERIKPQDIALFHGKLDQSELGWGERLIVRSVRAELGDYRDWENIEEWAEAIHDKLMDLLHAKK